MVLIVYPIFFVLLYLGFSAIRAGYTGLIPESFAQPSLFYTAEDQRNQSRIALPIMGVVGIVFAAILTCSYTKALVSDEFPGFFAFHWHGLRPCSLFGTLGMMVGAGLLRLAFLKQLPEKFIPKVLRHPYRYNADPQKVHEQMRLLSFTAGVFLAGLGVLFYYFV